MLSLNRFHILTFHGIGEHKRSLDPGEDEVWVQEELFSEVCKFAAKRSDIKITFDDGNDSDIKIAMPELLKNNLKGIFFIVADRIGKQGYLKSCQLVEMKQDGMIIGLHGMYHRPWPGLSTKELNTELIDAKNKIEEIIGEKITLAALPFGAYNRRVLKRLKELDFKTVYTCDKGITIQDRWIQHRTSIYSDDDLEKIAKLIDNTHSSKLKILKRDIKFIVKSLR